MDAPEQYHNLRTAGYSAEESEYIVHYASNVLLSSDLEMFEKALQAQEYHNLRTAGYSEKDSAQLARYSTDVLLTSDIEQMQKIAADYFIGNSGNNNSNPAGGGGGITGAGQRFEDRLPTPNTGTLIDRAGQGLGDYLDLVTHNFWDHPLINAAAASPGIWAYNKARPWTNFGRLRQLPDIEGAGKIMNSPIIKDVRKLIDLGKGGGRNVGQFAKDLNNQADLTGKASDLIDKFKGDSTTIPGAETSLNSDYFTNPRTTPIEAIPKTVPGPAATPTTTRPSSDWTTTEKTPPYSEYLNKIPGAETTPITKPGIDVKMTPEYPKGPVTDYWNTMANPADITKIDPSFLANADNLSGLASAGEQIPGQLSLFEDLADIPK
jgi:hypothetical protein